MNAARTLRLPAARLPADPSPRPVRMEQLDARLPGDILAHPGLHSTAKLVAAALDLVGRGPLVTADNARLARALGDSVRTIQAGLDQLECAGLVHRFSLRQFREWRDRGNLRIDDPAGSHIRRVIVLRYRLPLGEPDIGPPGRPAIARIGMEVER